jgi:hypothetical protein
MSDISEPDLEGLVVPDDVPIDQHIMDAPRKKRKRLIPRRYRDSDDENSKSESESEITPPESEGYDSDEAEDRAQSAMDHRQRARAEQDVILSEMHSVADTGRSGNHKYLHLLNGALEQEEGAYPALIRCFRETIYDQIRFGNMGEYTDSVHELAMDTFVRVDVHEYSVKGFCMLCQRHIEVNTELRRDNRVIGEANKKCADKFLLLRRAGTLRGKIAELVLEAAQLDNTGKLTEDKAKDLATRAQTLAGQCYSCALGTAHLQ